MENLKQLLGSYSSVFVVYDGNVECHLDYLGLSLCQSKSIVASEENKNIETVVDICRWLLEKDADRNSLLLAVGGGVTTDLAGFAACIYKRGIRFANVPTTLLSQVDAGLGGKTGVNLDGYKNILGVIRQPEFSYIDSSVLKTLPEEQLRSGAAEMLKSFIIDNSSDSYEKAVAVLSEQEIDFAALEPLIKAAAEVKKGIVSRDPYEKGERRVLNLGHTYAHAIEWYEHSNQVPNPLSHGEAVAIGIVKAAEISEMMGIAPEGLERKLRSDLLACGLPVEMPYAESELQQAIRKDKKAEDGKINFVLIERIGKVRVEKI